MNLYSYLYAVLTALPSWTVAESDCNATIKMDPTFVKAYARRGTARMNLDNLGGAREGTRSHNNMHLDHVNFIDIRFFEGSAT